MNWIQSLFVKNKDTSDVKIKYCEETNYGVCPGDVFEDQDISRITTNKREVLPESGHFYCPNCGIGIDYEFTKGISKINRMIFKLTICMVEHRNKYAFWSTYAYGNKNLYKLGHKHKAIAKRIKNRIAKLKREKRNNN